MYARKKKRCHQFTSQSALIRIEDVRRDVSIGCRVARQRGVLWVSAEFKLPPEVPIVFGTHDGTGQGSHWLIECPVILVAHIETYPDLLK